MADTAYFGRYYYLRLSNGDGTLAEYYTESGKPALDIKFNVSFCRNQHCRMGTVSILGLKWETMHTFLELSAQPKGVALSKMLRVELQAGYFTTAGVTEIITGFAHYAKISSPPNMWLDLQVAEYNPAGGKTYSGSITANTLAAVAAHVIDVFSKAEGVDFDFSDNTQDKLCSESKQWTFNYEGTMKEVIESMSKNLNTKVQFILKGAVLEAYDKATEKAANGNIDVDKDHGLLSVTGIDAVNGDVTTFLSNTDPNLTFMTLTSQLNPQANGKYQIVKKQYVGHYAGQEWYVKYHCTARSKDAS